MKNTIAVGDICHFSVLSALLRAGKNVLQPVSNGLRYDLVIEENGKFSRVQCKNGRLRGGAVTFRPFSSSGGGKHYNYVGQVELFGVFCPETNCCYLIPIELCPKSTVKLRVHDALNGQRTRITLAAPYEITPLPV